ncbi:hypothetical protein Ancab_036624 [Ancistrocladus abbreviatus]
MAKKKHSQLLKSKTLLGLLLNTGLHKNNGLELSSSCSSQDDSGEIELCREPSSIRDEIMNHHILDMVMIASTWDGLMVENHKDCCIRKLWKVKQALKALNTEHFVDTLGPVESYKVLLKQCQTAIRNSLLNQDLVAEERRLRLDLQKLLKAEESFYKQKSRAT